MTEVQLRRYEGAHIWQSAVGKVTYGHLKTVYDDGTVQFVHDSGWEMGFSKANRFFDAEKQAHIDAARYRRDKALAELHAAEAYLAKWEETPE